MSEQEQQNLWGDIPKASEIRQPVNILREQGSLLTKETRGVLRGVVRTRPVGAQEVLISLNIAVPALDGYSYELLQVVHGLTIPYPANIEDLTNRKSLEARSEEQFISFLGTVLSSAAVRNVVSTLLAQSGD